MYTVLAFGRVVRAAGKMDLKFKLLFSHHYFIFKFIPEQQYLVTLIYSKFLICLNNHFIYLSGPFFLETDAVLHSVS